MGGTRKGAVRAYFFGFFVCTAGFLFGYDTGIVGGVLTLTSFMRDFHSTDSTSVASFMVSLQTAGAFAAALGIFPISESYGRRRTIIAAMAVFCTGVLLQLNPWHSLKFFYAGRFVCGLGLGSATAVVPAYSVEMAPKNIRGKLGSGMQWLFAFGVMTSYWISYGVHVCLPQSTKQWQIPISLQLIPAALLGLGLFTQKESFRWLLKQERNGEAWDSLTWIRADDGPEVHAEFGEVMAALVKERRAARSFKKRELLEPANRYRLSLAFGVFLGQQATGMTALAYFGPQFFRALVGDGSQTLLISSLYSAEKVIAVGIYIFFFSEKWGRKPTLWVSALLMACCFIIVCVIDKTFSTQNNQPAFVGMATVAMIFLTNAIYQFSWGPIPWPYASEVCSSRIREVGTSVGVSAQWLFNFCFSLASPYMINAWGSYTFVFYAVLDVITAALVFVFLKETKNKSIEEIETIFNGRAAFDVETARRNAKGISKCEDGPEDALVQRSCAQSDRSCKYGTISIFNDVSSDD